MQAIAIWSEKCCYNQDFYNYLIEKRSHNPELKLVINTVTNLMANTKFSKKKNKAPMSLLVVLELIAEMLMQCKSIMNFLSDELLF